MVARGYDKDVEGVLLDYLPSDIRDYDSTDFDLRITLGADSLDHAFWVTVPGDAERLTLRQLIDTYLLGTSKEDRDRIRESLDTDTNPDLPELWLAMRRAFDDALKGRATLRVHLNKGPLDVNLDEPAKRHFSRAYSQELGLDYRLIDLVLEVTDIPGLSVPPERRAELTRSFRALLLLYLMDRFQKDFTFEGHAFDQVGVEAVADWCVTQGWLDLSAKSIGNTYKGVYVRKDEGNRILRDAVRETDNLIQNYDQFADVTVDEEPPRFRTGRGEDLRIPVYQAEGFDPLRAAFLMNLENGYYDANWQQVFRDEAWFTELLTVAGAECPVSPQKLERIIRAGKAWVSDRRDESSRSRRASRLWDDAYRD
jgi:hypothetical protein